MHPQPKSKFEELTEQINQLHTAADGAELEIQRIRSEVDRLMQTDPAQSHALHGALAALTEDPQEVRRRFGIALKMKPHDPILWCNYSAMLYWMGFFSEACPAARRAHELAPTNLGFLDELISQLARALRFVEANKLLTTRDALNPEKPFDESESIGTIGRFVQERGIDDDSAARVMIAAMQVMHDSGVFRVVPSLELLSDEETEWLSGRLNVHRSLDEVMRLNESLAENLASNNLRDTVIENVVLMFMPLEDNGDHA